MSKSKMTITGPGTEPVEIQTDILRAPGWPSLNIPGLMPTAFNVKTGPIVSVKHYRSCVPTSWELVVSMSTCGR